MVPVRRQAGHIQFLPEAHPPLHLPQHHPAPETIGKSPLLLLSFSWFLFFIYQPSLVTLSRPFTTDERVITKCEAAATSALKEKEKKTPGGFLFNGARQGSAPAVWFINGTPKWRAASSLNHPTLFPLHRLPPFPFLLPPLQISVMDWTARHGRPGGLFVAQTILSIPDGNTHPFFFPLSSLPPSLFLSPHSPFLTPSLSRKCNDTDLIQPILE